MIQVRFERSDKRSVPAALLPDLVVGRRYNLTQNVNDEEFDSTVAFSTDIEWSKIIGNKSGKELGLPQIDKSTFRNERYVLIHVDGKVYAFPQIELARVLFLQNSKMFHYAIDKVSLGIDFQYLKNDSENLVINVGEHVQLSKSYFESIFNKNKLAYTLHEKSGLKSFESISNNYIKYRFYNNETSELWWTFGFNLPSLWGAQMGIRGIKHEHNEQTYFIVEEIESIGRIPHKLPENIEFFSTRWKTSNVIPGDNLAINQNAQQTYVIDEGESASSFLPQNIVRSQTASQFSLEPSRNTKITTSKKKLLVTINKSDGEGTSEDEKEQTGSLGLRDILGNATPITTSSNSEDIDKESDFYKNFEGMVRAICEYSGCKLNHLDVIALPYVKGFKLYKKGNRARCAGVAHLVSKSSLTTYTLIEIDISDKPLRALSTLLLTFNSIDHARAVVISVLEGLVYKSLAWPTEYIDSEGMNSAKLTHPQKLDELSEAEKKRAFNNWAINVCKKHITS